MAGPGGGSRGGGFGGGSFGGGGGHGGGFGGGHHHHHHHGFYYGPYYRRYGFFGFGGGLFGIFLMPFILIGFAVLILLSTILGAFGGIAEGGITNYQEKNFQIYADAEYTKAFGQPNTAAYEDNILIVFLTNEEADDYYCIAWVGDHVDLDINEMFGNQNTPLGRAINSSINTSGYWYSLDSNLALAVSKMTSSVEGVAANGAFSCKEEEHNVAESKLINYGSYDLNEETVNSALEEFTEKTGITMSIVVNDMDVVFGVDYTSMIISIIIVVVLISLSVFFIVKGVKARRRQKRGYDSNNPFA